jgi:hypothetical protein
MSLFQLGKVSWQHGTGLVHEQTKLHAGGTSSYKVECDALTDADLECVAFMLVEILPAFGSVEGVPTGGLRLAEKMKKYATEGPLLIVDDVLTTGTSMERQREGRDAIGAVIFARQVGPPWVTPLWTKTTSGLSGRGSNPCTI